MQNNLKSVNHLLSSSPTMGTFSLARHPALSKEEFKRQIREIDEREQARLAQERVAARQRQLSRLTHDAAIPPRFVGADLFAAPKVGQEAAYEAARAFFYEFGTHATTGAGMLLYGPVGSGKSHLACALAHELIKSMRTVLYCTALEAFQLVKSTWRRGSEDGERDIYERLGGVDLLILDEIGVQFGSETELLILTTIADMRSRNCLPTVVISNLEPEEIYGLVGERVFDRLMGHGGQSVMVPRVGRSLRQGGGAA